MRICSVSDVHTEFHRDKGTAFIDDLVYQCRKNDIDVLVVAGDFTVAKLLTSRLNYLATSAYGIDVVYTPGNHEYYHSTYEEVGLSLDVLSDAHANLHILCESTPMHVVQGRRFLGGTMWFPDIPQVHMHKGVLNDFRLIKDFERWVYKENARTTSFIKTNAREEDIVVTHHAPSYQSIGDKHRGAPTNIFYVNYNAESVIESNKPTLWFHGHTHQAQDYELYDTRVICNPHGYHGLETDTGFNLNLVVEI